MTDIVEELRNRTTGIVLLSAPPQFQKDGLCQQAADEITRLRADNEKLRAALVFYADDDNWRLNGPLDADSGNFTGGPAAAALKETGE